MIKQSVGNKHLQYIKATKNPCTEMCLRGTLTEVKPTPVLAKFSSRGPNHVSQFVLKPDLIDPNVNFIAAWSTYEYTFSL